MATTGIDERRDTSLREGVMAALADFSRSERTIADAFLEDPQAFANSTLASIAERTGISEPTIVRFCARLGLKGYRQFKKRVAAELASGLLGREDENDETTIISSDPIRNLLRRSAVAAIETALAIEQDERYDASAAAIADARRVLVYGVGGSSAVLAIETENRLFRLDITSKAVTDSYMQRMAAATLGSNDVVLLISSTGRPRALLDSAEIAKHYGATCIGICPQDSPLGRMLDVCIAVESEGPPVDPFQPSPLRYAQLFAIDSVAFRVAKLIGPRATQSLERIRASVAAMHGVIPNQPIGD